MKNAKAKAIAIAAAIAASASLTAFTGGWTSRQTALHDIAEQARALGLPEDNPIIAEASRLWWEENRPVIAVSGESVKVEIPEIEMEELAPPIEINQDDLDVLAKLIWKEAGACPWEHQCAVGCVVLNRVHDERFPDTVRDVVGQPGQYSTAYLSGFDGTPQDCYDAAAAVLSGEYTIPANVVWQANFVQGSGIWWASEVNTGWWHSITYFCY